MQHFVNHAAVERIAAEVFSNSRSRYYLLGAAALIAASAAGAAMATIWLGLALFVEEGRRWMATPIATLSRPQQERARLALAVVEAAAWAGAPAIAWFGRPDFGPSAALLLLCALLAHTALNARQGRIATLIGCAPYALLGCVFILDAAAEGALWIVTACMGLAGYGFAATLHHAHRAKHARMLDAEWVRQLNRDYADTGAIAWELDFARRRLIGADKLSRIAGRRLGFADVIDSGLLAPEGERDLVRGHFGPGGSRQIMFEHDMVCEDGSHLRLRHQGFFRAAPDGAPDRFTCVSRIEPSAHAASPARGARPLVLIVGAARAETTAQTLERAGFATQIAGYRSGLTFTRINAPALVVLEVEHVADWRLLERLSQDGTPVVAISDADERGEALARGAAEHVSSGANAGVLIAAAMRLARLQQTAPLQTPAASKHAAAG